MARIAKPAAARKPPSKGPAKSVSRAVREPKADLLPASPPPPPPQPPAPPQPRPAPSEVDVAAFRANLMDWYALHARDLPWRGATDPYAVWLSEIMLQQTRVASVQQRYVEFLHRWPTLRSLARSTEADVLAVWSGLGYYRRARMLHRAAGFVMRQLNGVLPGTSTELKTLPGIGEYTSAAIASIAFGESIAVVDGNVERVLLRIMARPQEKTRDAHLRVLALAQKLVPPAGKTANGQHIPGEHNQAMMELGATLCLPRAPLCLQCPVFAHCRTRGEHLTLERSAIKRRRVAHLFALRRSKDRDEILLEQRSAKASLMPGMFELPPLPLDAVEGRPPVLRTRHGITDTLYKVEVFANDSGGENSERFPLLASVPAAREDLHWVAKARLAQVPLTGLTRKCLLRLGLLEL